MPHSDDPVVVQIHSSHDTHDASLFSLDSAAKNIIFGSFAGMVSELFEYPFDLAKVRLQSQLLSSAGSQLRFKGPMDCLKQTWREEGFRGLYRGLSVPVVASMGETAALFVAYSSFQDLIRACSGRKRTDKLSIPELSLAAAGAGFATSFILTPVELVKCKMQVQMMNMPSQQRTSYRSFLASIPPVRLLPIPTLSLSHPATVHFTSNNHYSILNLHPNSSSLSLNRQIPGPFSIIRSIIQVHGLPGLWLGHTGTLVRETGGTAAWFAVKEIVADALRRRRVANISQSYDSYQHPAEVTRGSDAKMSTDLLPWESALAGAISGGACVLAFYPADTVKSAMQTEEDLRPSRDPTLSKQTSSSARASARSFGGTLTRMYAVHGLRGLYAGCGMTVARAVPSSGITFVVYDSLSTWLG